MRRRRRKAGEVDGRFFVLVDKVERRRSKEDGSKREVQLSLLLQSSRTDTDGDVHDVTSLSALDVVEQKDFVAAGEGMGWNGSNMACFCEDGIQYLSRMRGTDEMSMDSQWV